MGGLEAAIALKGGALIFLNVALQQLGVPLPAEPSLLVAGSLAARGRLSLPVIASAVLGATLLADLLWFVIGRRYGARALRVLFRVSSEPQKRWSQTERLFARWGSSAFALAKFIPGLPMAGPVLAGAMGATLRVFLVYDLLAMSVWAGLFTGLGMVFHDDVDLVAKALDRIGGWGLVLAAVIVTGFFVRGVARVVARRRPVTLPGTPGLSGSFGGLDGRGAQRGGEGHALLRERAVKLEVDALLDVHVEAVVGVEDEVDDLEEQALIGVGREVSPIEADHPLAASLPLRLTLDDGAQLARRGLAPSRSASRRRS